MLFQHCVPAGLFLTGLYNRSMHFDHKADILCFSQYFHPPLQPQKDEGVHIVFGPDYIGISDYFGSGNTMTLSFLHGIS